MLIHKRSSSLSKYLVNISVYLVILKTETMIQNFNFLPQENVYRCEGSGLRLMLFQIQSLTTLI